MPISEQDRWLLNEGAHQRLFDVLGAVPSPTGGYRFGVWAPAVTEAWVVGDFNDWQATGASALAPQGSSGVWATVVPAASVGDRYKFRFRTATGVILEKSDPLAAQAEVPPLTASIIADLDYSWSDEAWLEARPQAQAHDRPISVYELHAGSWRHGGAFESLGWTELAEPLAEHVLAAGFTHIELLPIMEHPFYGSWGYQTTGFFAPTSRYGTPTEFMGFVDAMHAAGIGVILDWVPSHFPDDDWGLANFDGTHLYDHADPKEGWHPDWKSCIFNYGRHEVRSFLVSSAMSWIERYHIDGIRVDAVASMLYRDYSREPGEWIPNRYGGNENLEAVAFLQQLNETIGLSHPDVLTIAEESTAWPGVTRRSADGGLGFHYKWDMGWMHDTLAYFSTDPVHRRYHHHEITFRSVYAFSENYMLPLSHDEVTHGKGTLWSRMPGDEWQKAANLRLLYANQWLTPGKKLLFMGQEFGQAEEWNHDNPVPFGGADDPARAGVLRLVGVLNRLYADDDRLHATDQDPVGFSWLAMDDADNSVLVWERSRGDGQPGLVCVFNHTPVPRTGYRIGLDCRADFTLILNTDAIEFGGSGHPTLASFETQEVDWNGHHHSMVVDLPPLSALVLAPR